MLAAAAAVLSFSGLTEIAMQSGISKKLAWLLPVSIDGSILAASLTILSGTLRGEKRLVFPWFVTAVGVILSVAGNALSSSVSGVVASTVHGIAPIGLLLSIELLFRQLRRSYQARIQAATVAQEAAERKAALLERQAMRAAQKAIPRARKPAASAIPSISKATGSPVAAPLKAIPAVRANQVDETEFLRLRAEGQSYAKVAEAMGLSVSAAKRLGQKLTTGQEEQAA